MNPKKAIDIKPADISVIGKPLKASGISDNSNLSLIPANITIARVNPIPAPQPFMIVSIRLYPLSILTIAIPRTAQLVVIRGRNTPRA